jgi:hypothetical protein
MTTEGLHWTGKPRLFGAFSCDGKISSGNPRTSNTSERDAISDPRICDEDRGKADGSQETNHIV